MIYLAPLAQGQPVAYRAWFEQDNGARWIFTLWPEEEFLNVNWEPLYVAQTPSERHATLRYERGTPGKENDMPSVVSCNWLPDGDYAVYLAVSPTKAEK